MSLNCTISTKVTSCFNYIILILIWLELSFNFLLFSKFKIKFLKEDNSILSISRTRTETVTSRMQLEKKGLKHVCEQRDWSRERVLLEGETHDKYFPQSFVSAHDSLTRETLSTHLAFTVNYYASWVYLGALWRNNDYLSSSFVGFLNDAFFNFYTLTIKKR